MIFRAADILPVGLRMMMLRVVRDIIIRVILSVLDMVFLPVWDMACTFTG